MLRGTWDSLRVNIHRGTDVKADEKTVETGSRVNSGARYDWLEVVFRRLQFYASVGIRRIVLEFARKNLIESTLTLSAPRTLVCMDHGEELSV